MEAITMQEDLRNLSCCISGQGAFVDSLHEVERGSTTTTAAAATTMVAFSSKQQQRQQSSPPQQQQKNATRPSPKKLPSFKLRSKWIPKRASSSRSVADIISVSSDEESDDSSRAAGCIVEDQQRETKQRSYDELFTMPSLLDDSDVVVKGTSSTKQQGATTTAAGADNRSSEYTATTANSSSCITGSYRSSDYRNSTVSHYSAMSEVESIALEVGHSAHEYLEECFLYTEVSVLDRKKFDAIPELVKSDFDIKRHLGKGSYSDVFEVVSRNGQLGLATAKEQQPVNSNNKSNNNNNSRRSSRNRRSSMEMMLSQSITVANLSRPSNNLRGNGDARHPRYAMKCLRPQIRSDMDEFTIGAEDIVHETAILATLDHPNIIKLHGRASGCLTDAFVLNDSYFIILDKLDETLQDRIRVWKKKNSRTTSLGPTVNKLEMAGTIADAMSYLHSKNVIFRDLKPANVGIDSMGVIKLFDFGFAIGLPERDGMHNPEGLLYDRCGTPRYMAPEVGLSLGYALPADVYSFGMLLWEMCSLDMPFSHIKSAAKFDKEVFVEGKRPALDNQWPASLRQLMSRCWCDSPASRPSMLDVKLQLSMTIFNMSDDDMRYQHQATTRRSKLMARGMRMNSTVI